MDAAHTLPILVEFGIGALLCAVGVWSGIRSGYLDLRQGADRRLIGIIAAGYLGLLVFYCLFTYWLPFLPAGAVAP